MRPEILANLQKINSYLRRSCFGVLLFLVGVVSAVIRAEIVPFTEVRKVWRNTTQPMCGMSGFFEGFFPLVRAINQKLPPGKRLQVLTGDRKSISSTPQ